MSLASELKCLEERRRELNARCDHLREVFVERCEVVTDPSYWAREGLAVAQRTLTSHRLISTALSLFNKFRK
jgi:hypothetical protein